MSGVASTLAKKRALAAGFGTNANAVPYLNQNFEALRAQSLSSGQLFCDPAFPAAPESLGFNELGRSSAKTRGVTWKRPKVRTEPSSAKFLTWKGRGRNPSLRPLQRLSELCRFGTLQNREACNAALQVRPRFGSEIFLQSPERSFRFSEDRFQTFSGGSSSLPGPH